MPKEEWGVKRVCPTTGRRFYDLNKDPIVSPYTGEVVNLDTGKTNRVLTADKEDAKPETAAEEEDLLLDDEDDVIEDDAGGVDLGGGGLEDDDDDNVSLDEIADVPADTDDS